MTFHGRAKSSCFWVFWAEKRDFLMRIMQFGIVFSMGSPFSVLASFWVPFGVSWERLWEPYGTHWSLSWVTLPLLGCPGRPLGSLLGPIWCSVGWFCALFGALWRKSGHQLDDFVSLGVKFGFFGVFVLWITFFPYLWRPLVEFVDIGSAGLDLGWITSWLNKCF